MRSGAVHLKMNPDFLADCGVVESVIPDGKGFKADFVRARRKLAVNFLFVEIEHFSAAAVHPFICGRDASAVRPFQRRRKLECGNF